MQYFHEKQRIRSTDLIYFQVANFSSRGLQSHLSVHAHMLRQSVYCGTPNPYSLPRSFPNNRKLVCVTLKNVNVFDNIETHLIFNVGCQPVSLWSHWISRHSACCVKFQMIENTGKKSTHVNVMAQSLLPSRSLLNLKRA